MRWAWIIGVGLVLLPHLAFGQQDQRQVVGGGKVKSTVKGGRIGNSTRFLMSANSSDDAANPVHDTDTKVGKYATLVSPQTTRGTTRTAADGCLKWSPSATSVINWAGNNWDSNTSAVAVANIGGGAIMAEQAAAFSTVGDPDSFLVHFDPGTLDPRVTIDLTIFAAAELMARSQGGAYYSQASLSGKSDCSLLSHYQSGGGSVFNYSWKATSISNQSTFSFSSNPVLGLNDSAIAAAFLTQVSTPDSAGYFVRSSDFTVQTSIPVTPDVNGNLVYVFGGEVNYFASINPGNVSGILPANSHPVIQILPNAPNPFLHETNLVLVAARPMNAQIEIIGIDGKLVRTWPAGLREGLNIVPLSRENLASGVYVYRVFGGGFEAVNKLIVAR